MTPQGCTVLPPYSSVGCKLVPTSFFFFCFFRFIEWGACCCSGGKGILIKDENGVKKQQHLIGGCKDCFVEHPIRTKACRKLAQLPSLIPLYSGIHGDAVISQRPQWIIQSNPSVSDDESKGTQVLIPIAWGLIELFAEKEVPRDENMIDYISSQFKVCDKQENMTNFEQPPQYSSSCFHIPNWLPSLPISQPNNYSSFEGSSTCSSLSNEHQMLKIGCSDNNNNNNVLSGISPENSRLKRKKHTDCGVKIRQNAEKGPYKSKNLITERKRRKRIKDGILNLRALVPKITKWDRLATLGDSADYIKELLATIENFRDELRSIDDEDKAKQDPTTLLIKDSSSSEKTPPTPIVVEVEVNQIGSGRKDFLVRIICKQMRGGFSRLMEVIDSLGLQVRDANITTLNGLVLNVVKVEAKTVDVEVNTLKHSLVDLLIN
ncbi:hypothetical protein ACS0TY_007933 [Phlomoides rotata]